MYIGDYKEDAILNFKFNTHQSDGTPITLAGTPVLSVYKSNSTTESTVGITLSVDFDSRTGCHNVNIDLSSDAFYAVGNDYEIVITTGTVDSISVVGYVVGTFSIENRTNLSSAVLSNMEKSGATIIQAIVDTVTNTHTPTTTEFQADNITEATTDHYKDRVIMFTTGVLANQAKAITSYSLVGGIGQFTTSAFTEAPSNNDEFIII